MTNLPNLKITKTTEFIWIYCCIKIFTY